MSEKPITSLPRPGFLSSYRKRYLPGDVIGGVTIALMLIPQSIAYALLAGLPPITGLYASIFPVLIYGLLGSSGVLTLGPTAITAIMILNSIGDKATTPESWLVLSAMLALTLGAFYLLSGMLRLGFVVDLLSRPVVTGYVNAAAIIILFSQIPALLGISVPRSSNPLVLIQSTILGASQTHWVTFGIGLLCVAALLAFKYGTAPLLNRWQFHWVIPFSISRSGPLFVVMFSTALVYFFSLAERGVEVVGTIPSGLPGLDFSFFDPTLIPAVFPGAVAIAFVGLMEGMSTAKSLAGRRRLRINANRELLAMGAANLISAITGGLAVTTSISRSAVNSQAGANTGLSSVVAALMMVFVVLFLTPVFFFLPKAALAGVIIVSVVGLLDISTVRELWRYGKLETLPFVVTVIAVFTTSIEVGIISGVITAAVLHLWQTIRPNIIEIGRVWDTEEYREVSHHDTQPLPQLLIIRPDESLYFANVQYIERYLRNLLAEREEVSHLILVCKAINTIDASALQVLGETIDSFQEIGITVYLSELKQTVYDQLQRAGFLQRIGENRLFSTTHAAVQATGLLPDDLLPL